MKSKFNGFPKEAIRFLRDLKKNNNRDWFLAHKQTYENEVKGSMIQFLEALQPEIKIVAPEMEVSPKSIFRIYRDVRFSKDKSPYKTHIAAYISAGNMVHESAGLYIHLDDRELWLGGGLYHPAPPQLKAVRTKIASDHKKLRSIVQAAKFKKMFGQLSGDKLTRVPKGFPCDHPAEDFLKHKDFVVLIKKPATDAAKPQIVQEAAVTFGAMMPLIRYLNDALRNAPSRFF